MQTIVQRLKDLWADPAFKLRVYRALGLFLGVGIDQKYIPTGVDGGDQAGLFLAILAALIGPTTKGTVETVTQTITADPLPPKG